MEDHVWEWEKEMLKALSTPAHSHKVTAFDWTEEFWAHMAQPELIQVQKLRREQLRAKSDREQQALQALDGAKRQEEKDIGTFEL